MLIGATIDKTLLAHYGSATNPKIVKNDIMRIFPSPANTAAKWDDARVLYCKRVGASPWFSAKTDGNAAAQDAFVAHLWAIPSWCPVVYATNRHEPEGDQDKISRTAHKADFLAILAKLDALGATDPARRARIKFGQANTKQWTESATKGNFDYRPYDTGKGDFFAIDAYMDTNNGPAPNPATSYKDVDQFLQYIKVYKYDNNDTRPRLFAEFGAVGLPGDTTGAARAAWIQGIHNRVKTWNTGTPGWNMPWNFIGWCWWNDEGTGGSHLTGIGKARWFNLDRRHNGQPKKDESGNYLYVKNSDGSHKLDSSGNKIYLDPAGGFSVITNSLALKTFNDIVAADGASSTPNPDVPDPVDPGEPDPVPDPDVPDAPPPDEPGGEADPDSVPIPDPDPGSGTDSNVVIVRPEPDNEPPRIRVDITWTHATNLPTSLVRIDPNGDVSPVRGTEGGLTLNAGAWTGFDYESPFGVPVKYVATAPVIGDVSSLPNHLDVRASAWLRHPGTPSMSVRVHVEGDDEPVRKVSKAVMEPFGRRLPIVVTDGRRKAKTSTITFRTFELAEIDALVAVTDDASVLLLDVPPSWGWGLTHQYMALGDLTETRTAPRAAWLPYRDFTAPYEVVERPVSGTGGPRTWVNVVTENATWAVVRQKYATWIDLINGRAG